jgi:hypothetical protein
VDVIDQIAAAAATVYHRTGLPYETAVLALELPDLSELVEVG